MSQELLAKYEYEMGPRTKYSTEYTWTLNDWSLLYGPSYSKGVTSSEFNLNGTIGTTCKLSISPLNSTRGLTVQFSDTQAIKAMKISYHTGNSWSPPNFYYQPISKSHSYNTNSSLVRDCPDHTLKIGTTNALVIVIKITIIVSDAFDALSSTVLPSQVANNKIKISDTDVEAFEQFLHYLYGGKMTGLQEMVEEMILIADFYNVSDLKIKCENVMLNSLSKSSAVRYLIHADKLNCNALKKAALHLIRNSTTIFEGVLLKEDTATMTCLKEILSTNRPATHTESIASHFSPAPPKFKI